MAEIKVTIRVRLNAGDPGNDLVRAVERGCESMTERIIDYSGMVMPLLDDGTEYLDIQIADPTFGAIEETEVEDEESYQ
jgi:hypothetical protein